MEFLKHKQFENSQSFIPEVATAKQSESDLIVVVISEKNLESGAPQDLQNILKNKNLQKTLKSQSSYIYFSEKTYLILYAKDLDSKQAYKQARKHHQTILNEYKESPENVFIQFTSDFSQDFINEYLYGLFIQNYEFQLKSYPEDKNIQEISSIHKPILKFTIVSDNFCPQNSHFQYLKTVAAAKLYSKQLNNTRANIATTDYMFNQAKSFAENNKNTVEFSYLQGEQLLEKGLNLMYAVGKANVRDSYLVIMHYRGDQENPEKINALVGKGVVYDCGGLSLKKAGMERMHGDKGGACTVFGTFKGIVELGLKINVVCTLAIVENCIDGNSYRVSDIIETLKGINVEVCNTDAEGRNILADAMTYTQNLYKPQLLMDVATLTGACAQTLGQTVQAVFTNDDKEVQTVIKHSLQNYEELWHLPITEWMRDNIQSDQGDIRNAGKSMFGGAGSAAAFLECFVEKNVKWFHFDIAPSNQVKGEGQPVRTLIDYLKTNYARQ